MIALATRTQTMPSANGSPPPSAPVCLLGMHRSGTSLASRMMNVLGVSLGPPEQLMLGNEFNPKGYWEHSQLTALNDDLLRQLGGSWHEPPVLSAGWEHSP